MLTGRIKPRLGAQIDWQQPLTRGLVGYWLFNEGAGTVINDLASNNRGTLTNFALSGNTSNWVGSYHGGGLDFDGTNDYIPIGNILDIDRTNKFTISIWVSPNIGASTRMILSKQNGSSPYRGYSFDIDGTNLAPRFALISTYPTNYIDVRGSSGSIVNNVLQHVVVVYNGTSAASGFEFYVNGKLLSNTVSVNTLSATTLNTAYFNIGARGPTDSNFPGVINSVMIYNRALSAEEVKSLYINPFVCLQEKNKWLKYYYTEPAPIYPKNFAALGVG